jgi:hypothetical protein
MRKNTSVNHAILTERIKDFVTFMLHKNAEAYGYSINYNANAKTTMKYVKRIFEFETFTDSDYLPVELLKATFKEWVTDLNNIISVIDNVDYTDKYTLNTMTPVYLRSKSEADKVDYINDIIFSLVFNR